MNETRTKLKVGILSFAHTHAASYITRLARLQDVEVLASDPLEGPAPAGEVRGRALAAELGVAYVDTYEELFDWAPDAVIICSENARHRPLVEMAAAAGAHVLCEKPLATEIEDGEAMIQACHRAGVNLMVAYPVRFSPMFQSLLAAVEEGTLGEIVGVTGTNNGQIPVGRRAWFTDPELSGGGAVMDHTVHVADLLDVLLPGTAESVYCITNQVLHSEKPQVQAETAGLVNITYANGTVATIDCSWSQPDTASTWGGLTLQVAGTKGAADIDPFALHVGGIESSTGRDFWLGFGPDTDGSMLDEFLSAVREGRAPQPDGPAGLRSLRIVKAAQESMRTGLPAAVGSSANRFTHSG